jgi:nucleotide-binding universal stress UspA family protein
MRIKTILCPIDESDTSVRALSYATAFAREYVARLSVLEVIDWTLPPLGSPVDLADLPPVLQNDVLGRLHRLTAHARDAGVPTELGIDAGPVVRRILERADILSADLLVVGTHGRQGFDRIALGSVAEKLLRKAHCPLLTVPPRAEASDGETRFHSILCAVDLSPMSAEVVKVAADIAWRHDSDLVLAHVVPWPFGTGKGEESASGFRHSLETRAREDLSRLLSDKLPAVAASTAVMTGTPRDEILACARNRRADLIVIGVSGHGAIDRALLGSTAHAVARASECPVLTLRGDHGRHAAK